MSIVNFLTRFWNSSIFNRHPNLRNDNIPSVLEKYASLPITTYSFFIPADSSLIFDEDVERQLSDFTRSHDPHVTLLNFKDFWIRFDFRIDGHIDIAVNGESALSDPQFKQIINSNVVLQSLVVYHPVTTGMGRYTNMIIDMLEKGKITDYGATVSIATPDIDLSKHLISKKIIAKHGRITVPLRDYEKENGIVGNKIFWSFKPANATTKFYDDVNVVVMAAGRFTGGFVTSEPEHSKFLNQCANAKSVYFEDISGVIRSKSNAINKMLSNRNPKKEKLVIFMPFSDEYKRLVDGDPLLISPELKNKAVFVPTDFWKRDENEAMKYFERSIASKLAAVARQPGTAADRKRLYETMQEIEKYKMDFTVRDDI